MTASAPANVKPRAGEHTPLLEFDALPGFARDTITALKAERDALAIMLTEATTELLDMRRQLFGNNIPGPVVEACRAALSKVRGA